MLINQVFFIISRTRSTHKRYLVDQITYSIELSFDENQLFITSTLEDSSTLSEIHVRDDDIRTQRKALSYRQ